MNFRLPLILLALAACLSGCQSTTIRSAWFDTDFTGPPFRKIMVVGDIGTTTEGRVFEDTFAAKLREAGVDALSGHAIRLDDPTLPEGSFGAAVANSGAQGLLFVRLLGVDTRTQVTTTMVAGGMGWGRGPWGGATQTRVPVQTITQYELATVEAKLYDVQTKQLVWAATTSTFNPRSVERETPAFADLVIRQLRDRDIIPGK
jgi:hypothetical protein